MTEENTNSCTYCQVPMFSSLIHLMWQTINHQNLRLPLMHFPLRYLLLLISLPLPNSCHFNDFLIECFFNIYFILFQRFADYPFLYMSQVFGKITFLNTLHVAGRVFQVYLEGTIPILGIWNLDTQKKVWNKIKNKFFKK